jgi:hypothetical protein
MHQIFAYFAALRQQKTACMVNPPDFRGMPHRDTPYPLSPAPQTPRPPHKSAQIYPAGLISAYLNINGYSRFSALHPGQKSAQIHPAGLIGAYLGAASRQCFAHYNKAQRQSVKQDPARRRFRLRIQRL